MGALALTADILPRILLPYIKTEVHKYNKN